MKRSSKTELPGQLNQCHCQGPACPHGFCRYHWCSHFPWHRPFCALGALSSPVHGGHSPLVHSHQGKASSKPPLCLTKQCMSVIPTLGKLRRVDSWVQEQPEIHWNTWSQKQKLPPMRLLRASCRAMPACWIKLSLEMQEMSGRFHNTKLVLHLYGSSRIIIILWSGLLLGDYQSYTEMK